MEEKKQITLMNEFETLTPKAIVEELDKYIIGQSAAKRAVAIALRNRARRKLLAPDLIDEVAPKNIIMIGPTGVGKTEIARRLSSLVKAPFIKVEATKYTEIGYVGRDVESMIRDLTNISVNMLKKEMMKSCEAQAESMVEERLLDILLPRPADKISKMKKDLGNVLNNINIAGMEPKIDKEAEGKFKNTREKLRKQLREGKLEDKYIEITVKESTLPFIEVFASSGLEELDMGFQTILGGMMPKKQKRRRVTVAESRKILAAEEAEKLIDMDKVISEAINRVENMGIVFFDEIDKIVGRSDTRGPDVSREGVQRDILPIVEGSTVMTKYGPVKTNHILFIAAGAFHSSKPSELIPELQGRFPIRVELDSLTQSDFVKILTQPKNALIKQYKGLLETEGVKLEFDESAIEKIAEIAYKVNLLTENIGARRLATIMEKLLEEISFDAPDLKGRELFITDKYVEDKLKEIVENRDLSRYIL